MVPQCTKSAVMPIGVFSYWQEYDAQWWIVTALFDRRWIIWEHPYGKPNDTIVAWRPRHLHSDVVMIIPRVRL